VTLQNSNNLHMRLRLALMNAAALAAARRERPATDALVEAVTLARKSGYIRVFFEDRRLSGDVLGRLLPDATKYRSFPEAFARGLVDALEDKPSPGGPAALTPRERDVLRKLGLGHPDKVIAQRLNVSGNTVKFHLKNIYSKLNATGRADAIRRAREAGLLD
jgi:LuxR family maltose regulon positive regulatory protein